MNTFQHIILIIMIIVIMMIIEIIIIIASHSLYFLVYKTSQLFFWSYVEILLAVFVLKNLSSEFLSLYHFCCIRFPALVT